jgi:hypothetical protein
MTTLERLEALLRDGWSITDAFAEPDGGSFVFEMNKKGRGSYPLGIGATLEDAINNCIDHKDG